MIGQLRELSDSRKEVAQLARVVLYRMRVLSLTAGKESGRECIAMTG